MEAAEKPMVITDMKKRISDVQMAISWRDFAKPISCVLLHGSIIRWTE